MVLTNKVKKKIEVAKRYKIDPDPYCKVEFIHPRSGKHEFVEFHADGKLEGVVWTDDVQAIESLRGLKIDFLVVDEGMPKKVDDAQVAKLKFSGERASYRRPTAVDLPKTSEKEHKPASNLKYFLAGMLWTGAIWAILWAILNR